MISSSNFRFIREVKSFPIVKAEIKLKLSIVDMTIAKRETIKNPYANGGSINAAKSRYGLELIEGKTANAYKPVNTVIKSKITQNNTDIIIPFLTVLSDLPENVR